MSPLRASAEGDSQNKARGRPRSSAKSLITSAPVNAIASSAGGNVNMDSRLSSTSGGSPAGEPVMRTAAELAREKKLRADPMADVHGPLYVTCKRCGNRIKLSPKSTYDPFHWQKHRERCLKKPVGGTKQTRREGKEAYKPKSKVSSGSSKTGAESVTPPLTPDEDDDGNSPRRVKEESPSPQLSEKTASSSNSRMPTVVRQPDLAFEDYLFRSRRRATRENPSLGGESWQSWNWDQLKAPVWVVASYPDQPDEDDEYTDDITSGPSQSRSQSLASTLPKDRPSACPSRSTPAALVQT